MSVLIDDEYGYREHECDTLNCKSRTMEMNKKFPNSKCCKCCNYFCIKCLERGVLILNRSNRKKNIQKSISEYSYCFDCSNKMDPDGVSINSNGTYKDPDYDHSPADTDKDADKCEHAKIRCSICNRSKCADEYYDHVTKKPKCEDCNCKCQINKICPPCKKVKRLKFQDKVQEMKKRGQPPRLSLEEKFLRKFDPYMIDISTLFL